MTDRDALAYPCGKAAVWSYVAGDPAAEGFVIRPDLCDDCFRALPTAETAGWRSRSIAAGLRTFDMEMPPARENADAEADIGPHNFRQYFVRIQEMVVNIVIVGGATDSPNLEGELTDDILGEVVRAVEHQIAQDREPAGEASDGAGSVHISDISAPCMCQILTKDQAKEGLPSDIYRDLFPDD